MLVLWRWCGHVVSGVLILIVLNQCPVQVWEFILDSGQLWFGCGCTTGFIEG